jgi:hypothetical protein
MLAANGATTHRFDSPGSSVATVVYGSAVQTNTIRWDRVANIALATWFVSLSFLRLTVLWSDRGADIRLYLAGTREWLAGGDPWSVHFGTFHFAAAPPSLLPMVPFALMPEPLAIALLTVLAVVASFWMLRKLGLPWWWIAFPPLVDNLWNGNPQLFLVPLLLGPAAWLAPIVKAYAVAPLIIQFRVRTLAITALVGLITLPILPWAEFIAHLSTTTGFLSEQSQGGMSAWFIPILVPFCAVALVVMGRQRASWWFVPALWPSTQWYYSLMAFPALTPLTAAILAAPVQGGPAVATIVAAVEVWYLRRRERQPAATSDGLTVRAPSS